MAKVKPRSTSQKKTLNREYFTILQLETFQLLFASSNGAEISRCVSIGTTYTIFKKFWVIV